MDKKTLKPGDTVLYLAPRKPGVPRSAGSAEHVTVFKLNLDAKYYNLEMESYIRARQTCMNNAPQTCIVSNHINTVHLSVAMGGAAPSRNDSLVGKVIQGKVVSWNNHEIRLDVGEGIIYTFHTYSNIIDTYNQTTVYSLKSLDTIYAKTDPEALKIGIGDSLEIGYVEPKDEAAHTLEWSQIGGVDLMVERTVKDISVVRKY